jgi:hypothetical protein
VGHPLCEMVQAVAASSTLCKLCMLSSLIPAAGAGLDNCACSTCAGGFDQTTTQPLRAVIGLSADPASAPNRCAPMQGKGSSAASAVTQSDNHECTGSYASPSRATSAAFGHNRRCRPGNLSFASSHGDGDLHDSGFVRGNRSCASWASVVVPKWSTGSPFAISNSSSDFFHLSLGYSREVQMLQPDTPAKKWEGVRPGHVLAGKPTAHGPLLHVTPMRTSALIALRHFTELAACHLLLALLIGIFAPNALRRKHNIRNTRRSTAPQSQIAAKLRYALFTWSLRTMDNSPNKTSRQGLCRCAQTCFLGVALGSGAARVESSSSRVFFNRSRTAVPTVRAAKQRTKVARLVFGLLLTLAGKASAFSDKASLQVALGEWCADAAAAQATHGHISAWDVSAVTGMASLLPYACKSTFDEDVNAWDVGQVTSMASMFYVRSAPALPAQPQQFRVVLARCLRRRRCPTASRATRTALYRYSYASLSTWQGASAFNQPLSFDTSSVTTMYAMFLVRSAPALPAAFTVGFPCTLLAPPPLPHDRPPPGPHVHATPLPAPVLTRQLASAFNQPLSLDTSSVTDMGFMFSVRFGRALPLTSTVGSSLHAACAVADTPRPPATQTTRRLSLPMLPS